LRRAAVTFPLIQRRRVIGLSFAAMQSVRRGSGSDVAGSRPYRPGDDARLIDWPASARLSLARGGDEFVVREHFAEEAPRVVVLADRRPSMSLFPEPWPWLSKPETVGAALTLIAASAAAVRSFVGYFDYGDGEPFWIPPRSQRGLGHVVESRPFEAPPDGLTRAIVELERRRRDLPAGSFVFVLSDFLAPPPRAIWLRALRRRWDVVPVIVQDPVWEQSFPDVGGIVLPLADPATSELRPAALTRREAARLRVQNEERREQLVRLLRSLDLDPVLLSSSDPRDVLAAFLAWADRRFYSRGRR
jgi:uncharacterized protein (DUF58 family)